MLSGEALHAMQAALPHAQKAGDANREILELVLELRDQDSDLGHAERLTVQQRIDELHAQMRRENEAAERSYEELSARHPDWVDYQLSRWRIHPVVVRNTPITFFYMCASHKR
jgi:hypothetical protein